MIKRNWKPIVFGVLITVLAIIAVAAKPQATRDSYYIEDGAFHDAFYPAQPQLNLTDLSYSWTQEGTFERQGDTWIADMPRFVVISGTCRTKNPAHLTALLYTDVEVYRMIDAQGTVISFDMPVFTQTLRVVLSTTEGYANTVAIKCNVKIETP